MVNLSTYLKSLLHLANQPGQFQIKGGAIQNSVSNIDSV